MAKDVQSKKARAAEARAQAEAFRAQERRRTNVRVAAVLAGALAFAAALTWVVWVIVSQGQQATDDRLADQDFAVYDSGSLTVPAVADPAGGIPVGTAGVAGQDVPTGVPRVDIYEDLICPACGALTAATHEDVAELAASGDAAVYYHPLAFFDEYSAGTHYSTRAAAALVTVAEHDPATFADFWVALFAVQPAEGGAGLTNSQIRDVAEAVGVSQEAIDAIADGEFTQWVTQATQQASIDGVVRTPTIRIDGEVYTGNWTQPGQLVADVRAAGAQ